MTKNAALWTLRQKLLDVLRAIDDFEDSLTEERYASDRIASAMLSEHEVRKSCEEPGLGASGDSWVKR